MISESFESWSTGRRAFVCTVRESVEWRRRPPSVLGSRPGCPRLTPLHVAANRSHGGRGVMPYAHLSAADREAPLEPEDLERLATAAYLSGKDSDDIWARAHHGFLDRGDREQAARCAFWLAFGLLDRGDLARSGGWLSRAQRLLDEGKYDGVLRGYLLLPVALRHILRVTRQPGTRRSSRPARSEIGSATPTWARWPATVAVAR